MLDRLVCSIWVLSSYVVNQAFLQQLAAVLDRGINVKLIFAGIESHNKDWMRDGFVQALSHLEALEGQYANLQLIQKHTHQKAIVVDTRYAIVGSFNFLMNDKVKNDETSLKIYEPDAIEKLRDEFFRAIQRTGFDVPTQAPLDHPQWALGCSLSPNPTVCPCGARRGRSFKVASVVFVQRGVINPPELSSLEIGHAGASASLLCWAEVAVLGN